MINQNINQWCKKVATITCMLAGVSSLHAASNIDTSTHKEANFDSGTSLSPFETRNTTNGNYVKVVSQRLKMKWYEANYLGNRNTRSAEIWSTMSTYGDVWVGFKINIPTASGSVFFPSDKDTIIAQFMNRTSAAGASTWAGVFHMRDNHLDFVYRNWSTVNHVERRVVTDIPRNTWHEIIYHMRPRTTSSASDGDIRIWYNGDLVVYDKDVEICFGNGFSNTQKFGMYCADVANYSNNETRTLYMDDIGVYDGYSGGYSKVDP